MNDPGVQGSGHSGRRPNGAGRAGLPAAAGAFVLIALTLVTIEALVVRSMAFANQPDVLAAAVTLDLVLGLPALGWFLLVRTRRAPPLVLVPLFLAGLLLAKRLLPEAHERWVDAAAVVLPLVEAVAAVAVLLGIRRAARTYRRERIRAVYPIDALRAGIASVVRNPLVAEVLATELWLLHAAFTGWFRKATVPEGLTAVPAHGRGGYGAVVAAIAGVLVIETLAVHLLLARWSDVAAWIATALSAYGLVWLVGDYHAMRLHPTLIGGGRLRLRCGLRWAVDLHSADVVRARRRAVAESAVGYLSLVPIGEPDTILELRALVVARGLFGSTRTAERIGLGADTDRRLLEILRSEGISVEDGRV